jgi:hypothetical protein
LRSCSLNAAEWIVAYHNNLRDNIAEAIRRFAHGLTNFAQDIERGRRTGVFKIAAVNNMASIGVEAAGRTHVRKSGTQMRCRTQRQINRGPASFVVFQCEQ